MTWTKRSAVGVLAVALLFTNACSDRTDGPMEPGVPPRMDQLIDRGLQADDDRFARGLAAALQDPALRRRLFEDLRDSPFRQHAIHLPTYLAASRGAPVLSGVLQVVGGTPSEWLAKLAGADRFAIRIPKAADRIGWRGSDDLVIVSESSIRTGMRSGVLLGYSVGGGTVTASIGTPLPGPALVVGPLGVSFGLDPEARRASAPVRQRSTVSTAAEEYRLSGETFVTTEECTPDMETCPDPGGGLPPNTGIDLGPGYTWADCFVTAGAPGDNDTDSYLDNCEAALAAAFAPTLRIQNDDDDPSRESYWAAAPIPSTTYKVRIFYALAYHRDTGTVTGHAGDSEFIVVDVEIFGGKWNLVQAFYTAHWGEPWPIDQSGWYSHSELSLSPARGVPLSFVAADKHANYNNSTNCLYSTTGDDCVGGDHDEATEVLLAANLGRFSDRLLNCVMTRGSVTWYPGQECLWETSDFKGWLYASSGSSSYRGGLTSFMF